MCSSKCVIINSTSIDNAVPSTVSICNIYEIVRCLHDYILLGLHKGLATVQYDSCTEDVLQQVFDLVTI